MSDFRKQVIHELSIQYISKNFDFKNNTPEQLARDYQDTYNKIEKAIDEQELPSGDIEKIEVHTY